MKMFLQNDKVGDYLGLCSCFLPTFCVPNGEFEVLNLFPCLLFSVCHNEAEYSHAGVCVSVCGLGLAIVEVLSATQTVLVLVVGSSTELKK